MTPERLREIADWIDNEGCSDTYASDLRQHADALEMSNGLRQALADALEED